MKILTTNPMSEIKVKVRRRKTTIIIIVYII